MTDHLYRPQRNWRARIHDGARYGVRTITVENELLRVVALVGKGTDIVELNYKPLDLDFVWLAPGGVRNPLTQGVTSTDTRAAFRESYPGGWQEIFPNGGAPSSHDGADFPLHGEVYAMPWDATIVEDTEDAVAVRFTVRARKVPCLLEKTIHLRAGEAGFRIEERLRNESRVPVAAMWGHHITFGPPFLVEGSRILLPPAITVVPHREPVALTGRRLSTTDPFPWPLDPGNRTDLSVIPEYGTPSDLAYLKDFPSGEAWYEIARPDGVGARIAWDGAQMPFLWFWQEFGGTKAYPWYGRNYNIGLEPFSSMPNLGLAEAVANGSALTLAPGDERTFWLEMSVIDPGSPGRNHSASSSGRG